MSYRGLKFGIFHFRGCYWDSIRRYWGGGNNHPQSCVVFLHWGNERPSWRVFWEAKHLLGPCEHRSTSTTSISKYMRKYDLAARQRSPADLPNLQRRHDAKSIRLSGIWQCLTLNFQTVICKFMAAKRPVVLIYYAGCFSSWSFEMIGNGAL